MFGVATVARSGSAYGVNIASPKLNIILGQPRSILVSISRRTPVDKNVICLYGIDGVSVFSVEAVRFF
jgi:hypothetical protein